MFKQLKNWLQRPSQVSQPARRPRSFRPMLEGLEDRTALSVAVMHAPPPAHTAAQAQPAGSPQSTTTSDAALNNQVLQIAQGLMGQQVGSGQSSDLAMQALQQAGAKTTVDYHITGPTANYVWGNLAYRKAISSGAQRTVTVTGSTSDIMPGDVVQFASVKIVTASGTVNLPHDTAIISANLGNGQFKILEQVQDSTGRATVQEFTIDLSSMTQGTVWVYHPVAKSTSTTR